MKQNEAAAAAAVLEAEMTCPIHYGTFSNPPLYAEWPDAERVFLDAAQRLGVPASVIEPGSEVPLT
jgi:L-ascorbate metabolism protein UlaG (beta-lactamase superfamily)